MSIMPALELPDDGAAEWPLFGSAGRGCCATSPPEPDVAGWCAE
jgi:hypothetical protein